MEDLIFPSIVIESFAKYKSLVWHLWSLTVCTTVEALLSFRDSFGKSGVILITLSLYATWSLPLTDSNSLFLLFIFKALIISVMWNFFFSLFYLVFCMHPVLFFRFLSISYIFVWLCSKYFLCIWPGFFFSFLYSYYSEIWYFQSIQTFLNVLCLDLWLWFVFLNQIICFFYLVFKARDSLSHLLYSVGEASFQGSCSNS